MKSEERHQLLQNDLSVATQKTVGFFERHLGTAIAAVCGILLVWAVSYWWVSRAGSENAEGWTLLESASNQNSLEELDSVVDKYKGKPPGQWAQLAVSEKILETAIPLMFTNREVALTDLKRSREGFDSLLQDKTIPGSIRERALWGLALCLETTCDGDTSKAVEAYERLLKDFPETIFKSVAEERVKALKQKNAGEFYAWFSKEQPKPAEVRPRDIRTDGINLPSPGGADLNEEPIDFGPPKTNTTGEETGEKSKPANPPAGEAKEGEPSKESATSDQPAPAEKPAPAESQPEPKSPTDGAQPPENKN